MKIKVNTCVYNANHVSSNVNIKIESPILNHKNSLWNTTDIIAYPPFINGHDHLIGNWFPKSGNNRHYPNSDIWVEDMKHAPSYLERDKVWINDDNFNLLKGNAYLLTNLGVYKNIFSGCNVVQDHISKQKDEYYDSFPINVIRNYTQCHSISMGNWWGDKSAVEEWKESKGEMPFILHLAEGIDEKSKNDFSTLKKLGLLQPNTLIVHGIALTKEEIKECAKAGSSICWCPESNLFLIGKSIDVETCLEYGVNLILGTDSTQSGSENLLAEIKVAKNMFPQIPMKEIFKMFTTNACKALFLPDSCGKLEDITSDILLINKKDEDAFENLLHLDILDIELQLYQGIPIYGNPKYLVDFDIEPADYYFFETGKKKKFVIGHPEKICNTINNILGYHKYFPYLPF